jgi:hypothetical protein
MATGCRASPQRGTPYPVRTGSPADVALSLRGGAPRRDQLMMLPLLVIYLVLGGIMLILLAGFEGPTITAAFRRDLLALHARGSLALAAGGPVWVAGALVAWPVVAACEAITWRERA